VVPQSLERGIASAATRQRQFVLRGDMVRIRIPQLAALHVQRIEIGHLLVCLALVLGGEAAVNADAVGVDVGALARGRAEGDVGLVPAWDAAGVLGLPVRVRGQQPWHEATEERLHRGGAGDHDGSIGLHRRPQKDRHRVVGWV